MGQRYEKNYMVNHFDLDKNSILKPTTLLNFLQDISTTHFDEKTASVEPGVLDGIWMILEWHVKLHQMITNAQMIRLITEPTYFRKFIAYRRYWIEDENGTVIGQGMSKWAYVNPVTRRQSNLPSLLNRVFDVSESAEKPSKIEFESFHKDSIVYENLTKRETVYSDIDVNQHVNNVAYVRWALDSLSRDFLDAYSLFEMKISFKKEVLQGEQVSLVTKIKETAETAISEHIIVDMSESECVRMQMTWLLKPTV